MCFNVRKSVVTRIGINFKNICANLMLSGSPLLYVNSINYLGVVFARGKKLSGCFDHVKLPFYRAFNALYARSKVAHTEMISVFLLQSFCLPLLTYSLEATWPSKSCLAGLDNLLDNAVRKIFSVSDGQVVQEIRKNVKLHSVELLYHRSLCKFLMSFYTKPMYFTTVIFDMAFVQARVILQKYIECEVYSQVVQLRAALCAIHTSMFCGC